MAEDLHNLCSELALPPFHLVGMSMGAANAVLFSSFYPEKVKSLVVVDWTPTIEECEIENLKTVMKRRWSSFDEAVHETVGLNAYKSEEKIRERLLYSIEKKEEGHWGWKADTHGIFEYRTHPDRKNENLWSVISNIQCPTLLLKGQESKHITSENAIKMVSMLKHGSIRHIPSAGHSIQSDNPEVFYQEMSKFLDELCHTNALNDFNRE